jgi:hypothetical protein
VVRVALVSACAAFVAVHGCAFDLGDVAEPGGTGGVSVGGAGHGPGGQDEGGAGGGVGAAGGAGAFGGGTPSGAGGTGPCSPYTDACPASFKCGVVDQSIGFPGGTACVPAGERAAWARCGDDADCARGLVCDQVDQVCRVLCNELAVCALGAACLPVPKYPEIGPIPGLTACTAHCHPVTGEPCSDAHGLLTCVARTDDTDCTWTQGYSPGAACSTEHDCGRGAACTDNCAEYCSPPGGGGDPADDCDVPTNCLSVNPALTFDGTAFGLCFVF